MTELATDAFRIIATGDAIPDDFVVPYYLNDRKRRIAIARVDDRLYAFDDLCTCTDQSCPLSVSVAIIRSQPSAVRLRRNAVS